jgi:hypothetical protein
MLSNTCARILPNYLQAKSLTPRRFAQHVETGLKSEDKIANYVRIWLASLSINEKYNNGEKCQQSKILK